MKTEQFLQHHGIAGNPFSEEDAQTDTVFKRRCLATIHHPAWNKFFGSPADPSTALVFGEKGSGKTALRLQAIVRARGLQPGQPRPSASSSSRTTTSTPISTTSGPPSAPSDTAEALKRWRLQDHMDAILALGVTQLVDLLTTEKVDLSALSLDQRRDLLLLAALYDQSTGEPIERRWSRLRRRSGFRPLWSRRDLQIGFGTTLLVIAPDRRCSRRCGRWSVLPWLLVPVARRLALLGLAAGPRRVVRARHPQGPPRPQPRPRRRCAGSCSGSSPASSAASPCPRRPDRRRGAVRAAPQVPGRCSTRSATRGIIVLIDRVDEPQQIEGDPRKMRALIWPLLDHKFLRHPGIGVKLLLPIELAYYLEKEDKEFYDRARPDKLNMIKPLRWTGPSLYDLASDRLRACAHRALATNGDAARGSASSSTRRSATTTSRTPWATCGPPASSSSSSTA